MRLRTLLSSGAWLLLSVSAAAQPGPSRAAVRGCPAACPNASVFNAAGVPDLQLGFDDNVLSSAAVQALKRSDLAGALKAMQGRPLAVTVLPTATMGGEAARSALVRAWQRAGLPSNQLTVTVAPAPRTAPPAKTGP